MSDDLISRQAALDIINMELNGWLTDDERLHLEGVGTGIECLPSAEPEGRWEIIHPGETGYSVGDFRCSVCGQPNRCYHLTRYCCNCGARMVNRGKVKKEKK